MKNLILLIILISSHFSQAQTVLITSGNTWKYFDQGILPASNWNELAYNDVAWSSGSAQFGYGEGDENTTVSYGGSSSNKYVTTYFRKEINVTNPSQFSHLSLSMLRDDGAVIYINGQEVWRSNMPSSTISNNTFAAGTVAWPNEDDWHDATVSSAFLVDGINVVAVEVHQVDASSSDVSFDFSMVGQTNLSATVTRGPYLQKATQDKVIIRWRTDVATDSKVSYGISPANLSSSEVSTTFTTEHEVELTNLTVNSTYYYNLGSNSQVMTSGSNLYFQTLPEAGGEGEYKFIALGDCGTGYQEQLDVKQAVINQYGNHFDGILLLGDNAYQSGFDGDYQDNFFDNKYNEIFENSVIWPAPGNHDYNNHIPFSPDPAYYDIFNCPTNGECGGVASGTEKYYSFDYGNIHFISLDSYDESRSSSGPMATWLEADLAANTLPWVVAYWHHPPYTKGSHDSDNDNFLDGELEEMREEILPIIEAYGVDLVLNGHSHSYERSMLIDSHYGTSGSFGASHMVDNGTGSYPSTCPYHKNIDNGQAHDGTVYCVMGNSGKTSGVESDWPHPVMVSYTADHVGAMVIEVKNNRLDAVFYTSGNEVFDQFTIVKTGSLISDYTLCPNESITLESNWPLDGVSTWSPGNVQSETYTISMLDDATIYRTDDLNCITETYNITIVEDASCSQSASIDESSIDPLSVYYKEGKLSITDPELALGTVNIYSLTGQLISSIEVKSNQFEYRLDLEPKSIYIFNSSNHSIKFSTHE